MALVRDAAPEATLSIKWAQPAFEQNGPFCYLRAFKNYVNLGFWRGASISTGKGILESSGEKMAHVKIATESDIRAKLFQSWAKEAVKLNQTEGDPTKRG